MKTDVNVPWKVKGKKFAKNLFFVGIMSASDEKGRIQIRTSEVLILIRTKMSWIHNIVPNTSLLFLFFRPLLSSPLRNFSLFYIASFSQFIDCPFSR